MTESVSKPFPQWKYSLQAAIFADLMYFLYSNARNFKLKQKYQQYGLCLT